MRTIGVVTTSRADYGIYRPILRAIVGEPSLRLNIMASGMHLSPEFGRTVEEILADGFKVAERVEMLLSSDTPEGIVKSMGLGTIGFAQVFGRFRPDILVVLGDRFEMFVAALAALPFKIPVAHLYGGEVTRGAVDDPLRHAMTKLSHLHFVATQEYAQRVIQLGEEPWRVTVCGAASLDNLAQMALLGRHELEGELGVPLEPPPLLVTFHPVTLEFEEARWQMGELLAALEMLGHPSILTQPNADTGGRELFKMVKIFAENHPWVAVRDNLGVHRYFSLMATAVAMVGNSSSGIIEAPSFCLPVVNIGTRQEGRVRAPNIIDVGYERDQILGGLKKALAPSFRPSLLGLVNPHGTGGAAQVITSRLREVPLEQPLILKRFHDMRFGETGGIE